MTREEEDRLAKRRAKRSSNDDSRNPSSRSPRRSTKIAGSDRRETTRHHDSQSKARARGGEGGARSVPGAVAQKSIREDRHKRSDDDAKQRVRSRGQRSDQEKKPGAVSTTGSSSIDSESRESRKMARHSSPKGRAGGRAGGSSRGHISPASKDADSDSKRRAKAGTGGRSPGASRSTESIRRLREKLMEDEEPPNFTSAIKEEIGDDEIQLQAVAVEDAENQQIKEQQAQIVALKRQMQNMMQPNRTPESIHDDQNDVNDVNDANDINATNDTNDVNVATEEPTKNRWKSIACVLVLLLVIAGGVAGYVVGTAKSPAEMSQSSSEPTGTEFESISPSISPTDLPIYTPPSKEDCDAIASGSALSDQDILASIAFVIELDVTLTFRMGEESWLVSLKEQLQSIFLPAVAGCSPGQLQLLPDFSIANGKIGDAIVTEDDCEDTASELCINVIVFMDLSLRNDNATLSIVEAFFNATTVGASPINVLGMDSLLSNIVIIRAAPVVPTDAPSFSPSSAPTAASAQPTDGPSFSPSSDPTTAKPTVAQSAIPSSAPVVSPTSLEPTDFPTKEPTQSPSTSPTEQPSLEPTVSTPAPTLFPSSNPSLVPTIQASVAPSTSPTVQDSQTPTITIESSVITPSAVAQQSSQYRCQSVFCAITPLGELLANMPAGKASSAIDGTTDGSYVTGATSSHTWTQWNPYWQVQGIAGPVSKVRVWNRNTSCCFDNLIGANVDLLDSSGVVLATRDIQGVADFYELEFGSVSGVATVRVSKTAKANIVLPEVEVLGSTGQSLLTASSVASQSSDLFCLACRRYAPDSLGPLASLAIDGNTNGTMDDQSVIHTMPQVDPWWQVDLMLTATVSSIVIWNRTDCCGSRLNGAKIYLKDGSGNILHTETVTSAREKNLFAFPPVEGVTAIRVALENTAPTQIILNFAEVEAFGFIQ
ncbi:unnamed protein product [Cylindrotheca closterium]|uniref:Fucolectin tachylectin-4 pentraxin-1 domain-containing protein n=1 Tax=Cylindrotheca closterium TaxID=2856 RepID=A0AAD2JGH3_9STRA|nr:unnamed protein product [Cylindrotheca closterium]